MQGNAMQRKALNLQSIYSYHNVIWLPVGWRIGLHPLHSLVLTVYFFDCQVLLGSVECITAYCCPKQPVRAYYIPFLFYFHLLILEK